MIDGEAVCPRCGSRAVRKDGRDRKGAWVSRCRDCRRRFTARSATPFAGDRVPPGIIALAVRW
jgi:transposase-like protein